MKRHLTMSRAAWPLKEPFAISRGIKTAAAVVVVQIESDGARGRGEAAGVTYHGETLDSITAQVEAIRPAIEAGADRRELLSLLPPGGARNAIDCALWDLEAKQRGTSVWTLCDIEPRARTVSAITIGIRSLSAYADSARALAEYPWLKIKVGRESPLEAVAAVRRGAPRAHLIVDANQAWSVQQLIELAPGLAALRVDLLEQPVHARDDAGLRGLRLPIPICADEPLNIDSDVAQLEDRYDFINIKLDKCGGLTAALDLAAAAREAGMGLMVGCMLGSSLSMAPAMVIAQLCTVVDLDGPLLQSQDWPDGIVYRNGEMQLPARTLWG